MLSELERLGTIAGVAAAMHLTAPGVSMQLSALEREVGLKLTERCGRGVRLTPAGRVVASHGRALSARLTLAEHELEALRIGAAGQCRIAAFPTAARTIVADVWTQFLRDGGPGLELTAEEPEGALQRLVAGTVDLAVVHAYSNLPRQMPDHLHVTEIGSEPVKLVVATALQHGRSKVDLRTFERNPWIAPTRQRSCFEMVERACGLAGFRPTIVAESDDFDVQLALVRAGAGVALIPHLALDRVPDGVIVIDTAPRIERHLFVATRAELANDPCTGRVTDTLRSAMAARLS